MVSTASNPSRLLEDKGGGGQTAGGRDDWSPGGITSMVIPASNQKTREEVGKRPEDELTGAQGGLPP